ncbi:hypothetical protein ACFKHW_29680 [Bradyrhizobium lupini]|uniref:hypothetical protein n=1 Tax=Rhizobium lupini TaxID=136996 RepID=UPI003672B8D5
MTDGERASLGDPFFELVLARGRFPGTAAELLAVLNESNGAPEGLPEQMVFVVAEAGQIPFNEANSRLPRSVRYVVTRGRSANGPTVLVSTRPPATDPTAFLQVAGWDSRNKVFHFYERAGDAWLWEGSSWHAFDDAARGKGPFDSHVNGTLVMKELRLPWLHWNSTAQEIPLESFPPDHPVRTDPLFAARESADILERRVVRPAVQRWTRARLDRLLGAPGGVAAPRELLRHLLAATSVNIVSSEERSRGSKPEFGLPATFFFDVESIVNQLALDISGLGQAFQVRRPDYESAVAALGLVLKHSDAGFQQAGDAFFAWPVSERAFEDCVVVGELTRRGILSPGFALGLLMVDAWNPIDSAARESLLQYVPAGTTPAGQIEAETRRNINNAAAGLPPEAPERIAADYLTLDEGAMRTRAAAELDAFVAKVRARLATSQGVLDFMRVADWRRRAFRKRRIAEFGLTLPFSNIDENAPPLAVTRDAEVVER